MTSLETYIAPESQKPADLVAVLARVAALKDVIDEREGDVRGRLETSVRQMEDASGGQFTVRADAGTAYIAGGNPKPYVTDAEAFADWLDENTDVEVLRSERVEVLDVTAAVELLSMLDDHAGNRLDLAQLAEKAFRVVPDVMLPKDAADDLVSEGRAVADGDRLVDTTTGETVPGVAVRYTREQLTVRPDKAFRAAVANQIRGELPALDGGGS